jgi:hypothetical protein
MACSPAKAKADPELRCSSISYFHPLPSYCHKVLTALYENGTRFEPAVSRGTMAIAFRNNFRLMCRQGKTSFVLFQSAGSAPFATGLLNQKPHGE